MLFFLCNFSNFQFFQNTRGSILLLQFWQYSKTIRGSRRGKNKIIAWDAFYWPFTPPHAMFLCLSIFLSYPLPPSFFSLSLPHSKTQWVNVPLLFLWRLNVSPPKKTRRGWGKSGLDMKTALLKPELQIHTHKCTHTAYWALSLR